MGQYQVTGPGGEVFQVDAPSDAAAREAVTKMFGGEQSAPPVAPPPELPPGIPVPDPAALSAAPQETAPPPDPELSLIDRVMSGVNTAARLADQGVRGVGKGVMNIAGFVPDMMGLANDIGVGTLDKLGATRASELYGEYGPGALAREYMGSDRLKKSLDLANNMTADALGVERPTGPQTAAERMIDRVGQEAGAAVIPVGMSYRAAEQLGAAGARELPNLARMFVEPMAVNAPKTLAKEASAVVAAGTGGAVAGEISGRNRAEAEGRAPSATQNLADLFGALAGVGTAGLTKAIYGPVKTAVTSMTGSPNAADSVIRDVTVDEIARAAGLQPGKDGVIDTAPLADQIDAGKKVSDTIPGFQESTADRTANPGLAAMEYGRQSGPNVGQFTARRSANTEAIDAAMAKSEPQGTPGALRSELELERERRLTDAAVVRQNSQEAFDRAAAALQPAMTAEARGADIRAALEDAHTKVKAAVGKLYEPVNSSTEKVDVAPLADEFGGVTDNLSVAERRRFQPTEAGLPKELVNPETPPTDTGLVDQFGRPITKPGAPAEGAQPLNEITGIRSALTDQARAARTAGRDNEARVIDQYVSALDTYVDEAIPPELRTQWDEARAARKDMADRFERPQTAIAQTLDRREGQYTQPNSAVPGKFVQSDQGRIADFEALMREAGSDARVTGAVRDQVLQDVQARGLLDKPEALQTYLDQYRTIFDRFPALRDQLGNAQSIRRELDTVTTAESDLLREIGPQGRSVVAKYLQYGDENAQKAMNSVLASKDPAKAADELLSFVGDDPKAVEGARKVFWDILQSKSRRGGETTADMSGAQPWMPKALARFVDNPANEAVATRLYRDNPEHWTNIKAIAEAIQGVDVRNATKAPNTSGTPQGLKEGFAPSGETLASRIFAVERGVVSPAFAGLNIIGIMARKATKNAQVSAVNQAIDKALLDPEWAAALLRENNPANRAALRRSAKGWLGNETSTLVDMLEDKQPDEDTKDAVMGK